MNMSYTCKIMKWLGLKTLPDYALPMKEMVEQAIRESVPDRKVSVAYMQIDDIREKNVFSQGYFIERFLAKIQEANEASNATMESNPELATFKGQKGQLQLLGTAMDLFVAGEENRGSQVFISYIFVEGTDTTSTILEWSILYMCAFPEVR